MIASWMLYCSLCALGLTAAAALAEQALLRGRGPVRVVWIAAVFLSLLVPAVALRFAPRPATVETASTDSGEVQGLQSATKLTLPIAFLQVAQTATTRPSTWRAILARWDNELIVAWITLSCAVAFNFFGGMLVLAWMRRRWQHHAVMVFRLHLRAYRTRSCGCLQPGDRRPAVGACPRACSAHADAPA
jgi:hypothetical protein